MQVKIERTFLKQLAKLPKNIVLATDEIKQKLEVAKKLQSADADYVKMQGRENRYRASVGDYRIIAEYIHPKVVLLIIVKHGDAYKKK